MWPEASMAKAGLDRTLRERAGGHGAGDQAGSAYLAALRIPDEKLIGAYLAPYPERTRRAYWAVMLEWLRVCMAARCHILRADRVMIESWAKSLRGRYAVSTVAGRLSVVCGFYRWAHQEGLVGVDQGRYVRRPRRGRRSTQVWLSAVQVDALLRASLGAGPDVAVAVHLLGLNGVRVGDVLAARVEDVGVVDGYTTLRLPHRKGDVLDVVALPVATVRLLPAVIGDRVAGPLVRGDGGGPVTAGWLYRRLDALQDAAGLPVKVRPHMLRASFVTIALDAGVSARDIMASTGHVSVEMVAYYDRAYRSIARNASHAVAEWIEQAGDSKNGPPTR